MLLGIECGVRSHGYAIAAEHLGIPVRLIDCSRSDCIERIRGCDAFIWHFSHQNPREMRTFHAIIIAAMYMGIRVYPDLRTCWMFDDKLSEKYLLEALGEPLVPTHVFFDAEKAKSYFDHCTYPVVHKLAGGAGSTNVHLIRDRKEGYAFTEQTFSGGGVQWYRKMLSQEPAAAKPAEGVFLLVQEFLPDNAYDIRVTTIGEKATIFRRYVREHDFRASGSGKIDYETTEEDRAAIPLMKRLSRKLKAQTMTADFIYDRERQLKICEIGYGFTESAVDRAPGWYDDKMEFHPGHLRVFEEVVRMVTGFDA